MAKIASEDKIRTGLSLDHPDRKKLQSALQGYQKTALNICVIGQSGVGKSSFINAIRSIDRKHSDAAPTDVIENTLKATPYEVSNNRNIRYWDVPGEFHPLLDQLFE
jgi:interferon gamma inducible protein 47